MRCGVEGIWFKGWEYTKGQMGVRVGKYMFVNDPMVAVVGFLWEFSARELSLSKELGITRGK